MNNGGFIVKLNPVNSTPRYHSVVEFVDSAKQMFDFSKGRDQAFIEYMREKDKYYLLNLKEFIPYAKEYLFGTQK